MGHTVANGAVSTEQGIERRNTRRRKTHRRNSQRRNSQRRNTQRQKNSSANLVDPRCVLAVISAVKLWS
jgi:hypothetical protein